MKPASLPDIGAFKYRNKKATVISFLNKDVSLQAEEN